MYSLTEDKQSVRIGTLSEKSLHASVKSWLACPGDILEARVLGFWVDILRGGEVLEVQTRSFTSMKKKLSTLLEQYKVTLVYPVARTRYIVRLSEDGEILSRRKSPKVGTMLDLFDELISIPHLIEHPNFKLVVLFVTDEEHRCEDGKGSWRRKRISLADRRLLEVNESLEFAQPSDFLQVLPDGLPVSFSVRDLSRLMGKSVFLARRIVYCLKKMRCIEEIGKKGNAILYSMPSVSSD